MEITIHESRINYKVRPKKKSSNRTIERSQKIRQGKKHVRIQLVNTPAGDEKKPTFVKMDRLVYEFMLGHYYYNQVELFKNLRRHQSGTAVNQFQYLFDGKPAIETIYLRLEIARLCLPVPEDEDFVVGSVDGDINNLMVSNLEWMPKRRITLRGLPIGMVPYRGVSFESRPRKQDAKLFRVEIYVKKAGGGSKRKYLGMYLTAEEAAEAYLTELAKEWPQDVELVRSLNQKAMELAIENGTWDPKTGRPITKKK